MIAYTVRCTFTDAAVADEWIDWLRAEHLKDVLDGGADEATVVRLDGRPTVCEVIYRFGSREVFDAYERDHAPRLRAEGLARFPLDRGLAYERSVGEIVARL